MPTTTPPVSAAPLEAASMTPPKPPEHSVAPLFATAAPTRRASAAVRLEHVPSPMTPICSTLALPLIISALASPLEDERFGSNCDPLPPSGGEGIKLPPLPPGREKAGVRVGELA